MSRSFLKKVFSILPRYPRRRYNMYVGTNSLKEWFQILFLWLTWNSHENSEIISEYEREFAKKCNAKHAISFGAGRMALYAILKSLKIGYGDEVIIPAFTCVVVPNAILYRGAIPVYVDIEPITFNINVENIEAAITPNTKALYAQLTFGVACDIELLQAIAKKYNLLIIEDSAHALGVSYKGKMAGSLTDIAFFSTDHSKVINTHLGGMAVTNNNVLAENLRAIQKESKFLDKKFIRRILHSFLIEYIILSPYFLWIGRTIHPILIRLGVLFYFSDEMKTSKPIKYPYPCRLSSAQAQLGLSQLKLLPENLKHRRMIAAWLEKRIHWYDIKGENLREKTWLRYSFLVKDRRKFERMFGKYFDLGIWFTSVVSGRMDNFEDVAYHPGSCPVAEFVSKYIVNLPTHSRIPLEVIQNEINRNWYWLSNEIQHYSDNKLD